MGWYLKNYESFYPTKSIQMELTKGKIIFKADSLINCIARISLVVFYCYFWNLSDTPFLGVQIVFISVYKCSRSCFSLWLTVSRSRGLIMCSTPKKNGCTHKDGYIYLWKVDNFTFRLPERYFWIIYTPIFPTPHQFNYHLLFLKNISCFSAQLGPLLSLFYTNWESQCKGAQSMDATIVKF